MLRSGSDTVPVVQCSATSTVSTTQSSSSAAEEGFVLAILFIINSIDVRFRKKRMVLVIRPRVFV